MKELTYLGITAMESLWRELGHRPDALAIAKAIPVKSTHPVLAHAVVYSKSDGAAFLGVTDLERSQVFQPRKLSGNFPDWQRLMPNQADAKFTIAFNAKYIAELMQQFMGASADPTKAFVTWRFTDNISAVRMDAVVGDAQTMTAILMPVRVDTDTPQEKAGEELQSFGLPVGETEAGARIQSLEAEVASLKAELAKAKGKPAPVQPAAAVKPIATVTWVPMRNGSMRAVTA